MSRAILKNPSNVLHTYNTGELFPTVRVPGTDINLSRSSAVNLPVYKINQEFQPETAIGSTVLNDGGKVQFKIPHNQVSVINSLTVEIPITNSTGAATTLCDVWHLIDTIRVKAPHGASSLVEISGDDLYNQTALLTYEQWSTLAGLANTTSAWGAPTAIGIAGSVTYYLRLIGDFFEQVKPLIAVLDGDLYVELRFRPFSETNAAAGTAPTLNTPLLIVDGVHIDASAREKLMKVPRRDYRFLNRLPQVYTQSLAASTTYTLKMDSIKGLVSHIFFFVRAASATGADLKSYEALTSFAILDAANQNLIGGEVQDSDFNLKHEFPEVWQSQFSQYHNLYSMVFNTDPKRTFMDGGNYGYMPFDGTQQLRFTTPSGLSTASYDIVIAAWCYAQANISKGTIEVLDSAI